MSDALKKLEEIRLRANARVPITLMDQTAATDLLARLVRSVAEAECQAKLWNPDDGVYVACLAERTDATCWPCITRRELTLAATPSRCPASTAGAPAPGARRRSRPRPSSG